MESYVFRSENGHLGYFQIESDQENCTLAINRGFFDVYEKFSSTISSAQRLINSPHNDLTWIVSPDPIVKIINAICWAKGETDCMPVVEAYKNNSPGLYHPRGIRDPMQLSGLISSPPVNESEILDEIRSFSSIVTGLIKSFDYIEPETANLNTYGNKLRELLIIACTEVEYLWIKFLHANSYILKDSYHTNDYVKCLPHLKLADYEVQFTYFPSLGSFKPFQGWSAQQPTQSLSWYNSYNAVKHNRGSNMPQATLGAVINAIAAINILLKSQHGFTEFGSVIDLPNIDVFKTLTKPTWGIDEVAMPLLGNSVTNWTNPIVISL